MWNRRGIGGGREGCPPPSRLEKRGDVVPTGQLDTPRKKIHVGEGEGMLRFTMEGHVPNLRARRGKEPIPSSEGGWKCLILISFGFRGKKQRYTDGKRRDRTGFMNPGVDGGGVGL